MIHLTQHKEGGLERKKGKKKKEGGEDVLDCMIGAEPQSASKVNVRNELLK